MHKRRISFSVLQYIQLVFCKLYRQKLVFQVYDFDTWLTRMMFLLHPSRYHFGQLGVEGLMLPVPKKSMVLKVS